MTHIRRPVLLALGALTCAGGPALAGDIYSGKEPTRLENIALPKPADIKSLAVYPTRISLKGLDDAQQIVLTAELPGGRLQDLTGDVHYEVADKKIARVTSTGRVVPLANGSTEITAASSVGAPNAVKSAVSWASPCRAWR